MTLRGTSGHGPLELEIPIEALPTPSETIHQLAAKKAVQDLEEGRGWIFDAKDQAGVLLKDRFSDRFDELVKQEAVRLGVQFQIAGKWTSFVAVSKDDASSEKDSELTAEEISIEGSDEPSSSHYPYPASARAPAPGSGRKYRRARGGVVQTRGGMQMMQQAPPQQLMQLQLQQMLQDQQSRSAGRSGIFFGGAPAKPVGGSRSDTRAALSGGGLFGGASPRGLSGSRIIPTAAFPLTASTGGFGSVPSGRAPRTQLASMAARKSAPTFARRMDPTAFGSAQAADSGEDEEEDDEEDEDMGGGALYESEAMEEKMDWRGKTDQGKVYELISLQEFDGYWPAKLEEKLADIMGIHQGKGLPHPPSSAVQKEVWITLVVIAYLREELASEADTWELIVEKAVEWVQSTVGAGKKYEELEKAAKKVVGGK